MNQESIVPKIRQETKQVTMHYELKKDLQEDEVICEHCHGTGLDIADNVYGIKGDTTHIGVHFPYKHQSLSVCPHCYNGVLRKCPGCGAIRGRKDYHECPCGYHSKKRKEQWEKNELKHWNNAKKITLEEALKKYDCLYIDNFDRYVYDESGIESALEDNNLKNSLRIYATTQSSISLDADSVVEQACEDLYEDSYENCDTKSLQKLLDQWCEENMKVTRTYYPDYNIGVLL